MFTKKWKVYGADGHRQRESFNESKEYDFSNEHETRIISIENADKTGTNDYTIITITCDTEKACDEEMEGQITDGLFENCRVGLVEVVYEKSQKPFAERIDGFGRKKIVYRCRNCMTSFALLGSRIKYCYNCGVKIDWNVLTELSEAFKGSDEDEYDFMFELNKRQLGKEFSDLYESDGRPKKCENCIHACGTEECEIPKNKRRNIYIPSNGRYCQSAICDKYKEKR